MSDYKIKTKTIDSKKYIFDIIRKKYVRLTPEELVRQNLIHYLVNYKNYPSELIIVEGMIKYNSLSKRFDLVVYDNYGKPKILIECKSPQVELNENVINQISAYNKILNVNYLIISNGINNLFYEIDSNNNTFICKNDIPDYNEIK